MGITGLQRTMGLLSWLREWRERRAAFWADDLPNDDGEALVADLRGAGDEHPSSGSVKSPRPRGGRHRVPPALGIVTFPSVQATLPRAVPACGTRPPWDTASLPAVPRELSPVPEEAPAEGMIPGDADDPDDPGGMDDRDELQRYLDDLPGYPDD